MKILPEIPDPNDPAFNPKRVLRLQVPYQDPLRKVFFAPLFHALESITGLKKLSRLYQETRSQTDEIPFFDKALRTMNIRYEFVNGSLDQVPKDGPLLVVANHPFGAVEGVVLASILRNVRPDAKILTNFLMNYIPEAQDACIYVDPFGGKDAVKKNLKGMKTAMNWLKSGGLLGIFPAGIVAHYDKGTKQIEECGWHSNVGRIVRKTGVDVMPLFFDGSNSKLFHALGMIHPMLRTVSLVREFYNKCNQTLTVRLGQIITPEESGAFQTDEEVAAFLRQKTMELGRAQ